MNTVQVFQYCMYVWFPVILKSFFVWMMGGWWWWWWWWCEHNCKYKIIFLTRTCGRERQLRGLPQSWRIRETRGRVLAGLSSISVFFYTNTTVDRDVFNVQNILILKPFLAQHMNGTSFFWCEPVSIFRNINKCHSNHLRQKIVKLFGARR